MKNLLLSVTFVFATVLTFAKEENSLEYNWDCVNHNFSCGGSGTICFEEEESEVEVIVRIQEFDDYMCDDCDC